MQLTVLLLSLIFMSFNQSIYPKYPHKYPPKTQLAQANKTKNRSTHTEPETVIASEGDPVARKILELFATSILAFARLVSDPRNPSNIKSTLFGIATCWYQIFSEATSPDYKYN